MDHLQFSKTVFDRLDIHWKGETDGMDRPGFSVAETHAMTIVAQHAAFLGMEAYRDLAGNVHMVFAGEDRARAVRMAGSHLDAVPRGGRYDGPLGVVAPLAALFNLREKGLTPPQDCVVTMWRNEESPWFSRFAVGSHLATGQLPPSFVDQAVQMRDKRSLAAHMMEQGLNPAALVKALEQGDLLVPVDHIDSLVETHIEQGSVLEQQGVPLGLVTAIRGNLRYLEPFTFIGEAGHSGSVPLAARKDSNLMASMFNVMAAERLIDYAKQGQDVVFTIPDIQTINPSPTKIPDRTLVKWEVRSTSLEVLHKARQALNYAAVAAASFCGGKFERGTTHDGMDSVSVITKPAVMDDRVIGLLDTLAQGQNTPVLRLPSGAGHDAGIMALAGVPSGMIFVRHGNNGASHRPDEIMTRTPDEDAFTLKSDFAQAVALNAAWFMAPATGREMDQTFAEALVARGAVPFIPAP